MENQDLVNFFKTFIKSFDLDPQSILQNVFANLPSASERKYNVSLKKSFEVTDNSLTVTYECDAPIDDFDYIKVMGEELESWAFIISAHPLGDSISGTVSVIFNFGDTFKFVWDRDVENFFGYFPTDGTFKMYDQCKHEFILFKAPAETETKTEAKQDEGSKEQCNQDELIWQIPEDEYTGECPLNCKSGDECCECKCEYHPIPTSLAQYIFAKENACDVVEWTINETVDSLRNGCYEPISTKNNNVYDAIEFCLSDVFDNECEGHYLYINSKNIAEYADTLAKTCGFLKVEFEAIKKHNTIIDYAFTCQLA